ncbi:MAG: cytochrome P450 [Chitinophagaceae bacterium]
MLSFLKNVGPNPVLYFYQLMKQYGGVVKCRSLPDIYLVSCPVVARQVLAAPPHHFDKADLISTRMKKLMGEGLVVSNGKKWKRQRRTAQLVLGGARLQQLEPRIEQLVDELIAEWKGAAGTGRVVNASSDLRQLVLRIMAGSLLCLQDEKTLCRLEKSLQEGKKYVSRPRPFSLPAWLPMTAKARLHSALKDMDRILLGLMQERTRTGTGEGVLLAQVMDQPGEDGQLLHTQEALAEIKNLFASSYFSLSDLLAWLTCCLARYPEWADRIADENNAGTGGWLATPPDRAKFIHEVLRCYPPGWAVTRRTLVPLQTDACTIPRHATVLISIYNLHHHPGCWDEPEKFNPQRFDQIKDLPGNALFMPFGLGPRKCAGLALSRMAISMVCAKLATHFRLTVHGPVIPTIRSGISLGTSKDLEIRIEHR